MITMQIKQLMDKREEMKTCADVLTELLDKLHQQGMVRKQTHPKSKYKWAHILKKIWVCVCVCVLKV